MPLSAGLKPWRSQRLVVQECSLFLQQIVCGVRDSSTNQQMDWHTNNMTIRFGTDGWRAVISEDFTFANVAHVAQAIADLTCEDANGAAPTFVIGYDTRFLSDRYADTVAEVLAGNGIRVFLPERFAATPAISYAIVEQQASGGVMITASHNPPRYNGIKLKAAYGGSASPEAGRRVEQILKRNLQANKTPRRLALNSARRQGLVETLDPFPAYAQHIRNIVDFDAIARSGVPPLQGGVEGFLPEGSDVGHGV